MLFIVLPQASDLDRIKELARTEGVDVDRACRLIARSKSADVARWLYEKAGEGGGREDAYDITKACGLGDLRRIKVLAARPGFDVNAGWLLPMPGCGHDIYPYTTDIARGELHKELCERYGRTGDGPSTHLLYPLEAACLKACPFRPEVAAYLIDELGANVEVAIEGRGHKLSDDGPVTIMASAVDLGDIEVIEFLLRKGAKAAWEGGPDAAADCLLAAAALPSGNGGPGMLEYLLSKERSRLFNLACEDKLGRTPLTLACTLEREANVKSLLEHRAVVSEEDIGAACRHCNTAILELLLENGGALPPDNKVVTMISFGGHTIEDDQRALEVLRLLHGHGVDLGAAHAIKGEDGHTYQLYALHDATLNCATSCIEFLLTTAGADPDAMGGCMDHPEPGLADDWEGNKDLKYSNIYTDGYGTDLPEKINPVKALFKRAREAKRGGKDFSMQNY